MTHIVTKLKHVFCFPFFLQYIFAEEHSQQLQELYVTSAFGGEAKDQLAKSDLVWQACVI